MLQEHGDSAGVSAGVVDRTKLYLKKELTQIRKAARVLRDPETTSSLRKSTLSFSSTPVPPLPPVASSTPSNIVAVASKNLGGHNGVKQKNAFLHNWRNNCVSSSEKSIGAASPNIYELANGDADNGSSTVPCSFEEYSSTDLGDIGDNSISGDSYMADDPYRLSHPAPFRRGGRDTNLVSPGGTPPFTGKRRVVGADKRKLKKLLKQQQQLHMNRRSVHSRRLSGRSFAPTMDLGCIRDERASSGHSDDTEDYSDSENFKRISAMSPLISRLNLKNSSHSPSKLLIKCSGKDDSSYTYNSTPALSTSSYNNGHAVASHPGIVGLCNFTTVSSNGASNWSDNDRLDVSSSHGCGIPSYWSRRSTRKHRFFGSSSCSPLFSNALKRKESSIRCGRHTMYKNRYPRLSSKYSNSKKVSSRSAQGVLPLLSNGSSMGSGRQSDDDNDLSINFGKLGLEASNGLDGSQRSTSCPSKGASELQALPARNQESTLKNFKSLSLKYSPMFFDELIGQSIVVQSLTNATLRGRVAPVYLFQGPHGTGKTSAARIFAAALNCLATEKPKPCGICRECTDFLSSQSKDLMIIYGSSKKAFFKIRYLLKTLSRLPHMDDFSRYKVFVIDECHLLSSEVWVQFLKFLEVPLPGVVFIFITTYLDSMPRTVLCRCQKHMFNKIKDCDIIAKLRKISDGENLDIELDALSLISLNADGSLRDAETMLEQLGLLGKMITTSLVNELLGVVSDEKLLKLLAVAMSPDTAETVKNAKGLLDSGFDPSVIVSQMARLIMHLIAGTYSNTSDLVFGGRHLNEREVERLKHALKVLSDAEKQLRVSNDRSTWFTAALLQLGSVSSLDINQSGSSWKQICRTVEEYPSSSCRKLLAGRYDPNGQCAPQKSTSSVSGPHMNHKDLLLLDSLNSMSSHASLTDNGVFDASHDDFIVGDLIFSRVNLRKLDGIWTQCVERCHSETLRHLLYAHGRLLSISEVEGGLIAHITFKEKKIKCRAERFMSSITESMESVLRCNVDVRMILFSDLDGEHLKTGKRDYCSQPNQRIESIIRDQKLEMATEGQPKKKKNQFLPGETIIKRERLLGSKEVSSSSEQNPSSHGRDVPNSYPPIAMKDTATLECESDERGAGCSALLCCFNSKDQKKKRKQQQQQQEEVKNGGVSIFGECGGILRRS